MYSKATFVHFVILTESRNREKVRTVNHHFLFNDEFNCNDVKDS